MMPLDAALARLRELAAGLVYSSEGDRPFETVHLGRATLAPDADLAVVRTLLALPSDCPVKFVTFERALGRHTMFTDPLDLAAQAIRPRYEAIERFFAQEVLDATAVRTGHAPSIDVWLLGRTEEGELIGYHTVAIET
jgi:hypothetical protein